MRSPHSNRLALRRYLYAAAGLLIALATGACGSSVRTATGPTPVKCQVSLTTSASVLTASGGTANVTVETQPECTWTAAAEVTWISGLSATSGQGSGQIEFQVLANPAPAPRQGDVVVNDNRVRIEQTAAPCVFAITPVTLSVDASGDVGVVTVSTAEGCEWSATSEADWIDASPPAGGTGSGVVRYSVAPNSGPARSGSMTIAGHIFRVTQAAGTALPPGCTHLLRPSALSAPATGASHAVSVAAGDGCSWSATSSVPWITITSGAAGSGDGTIALNVAANTAGSRIGTVLVARQLLTVSQAGAGGCGYAISPTSQSFDSAGGPGTTVTVSTNAGCAWTASSSAPWITVTAGATGNGNGSVGFSVASNTGSARIGTLTIAGETFTVAQAGSPSCAYSINPTSQSIGASGGNATPVAVSTSPGCAWTATSGAAWISITSGAAGTGDGNVTFTVGENTGNGRSGTLNIAGQTVTVMQAAGATCSYTINPDSQSIGALGGPGTLVAVSTGSGCSWSATSDANWLTVNSGGSGSGNGTVIFTVAPNLATERVGTLTIAGRTFTVTQSAPPVPCVYQISPTSDSIGAQGGALPAVAVSTTGGCVWSAASNVSWITVTGGASGTGNGTVSLTVAANPGAARVGTVTIAGHTFTVTQGALACVYSIDPASDSIGSGGGTGVPITVTARAGCAWTAVSNDPLWITITSGSSGNGNGTVRFSVAGNILFDRTGTLTIAGHTFTVEQAGLLGLESETSEAPPEVR